MRNRLADEEIESRVYDLMEAGEVAVFAQDLEIMGDIVWLDLPDFDAMDRADQCSQAIIYQSKANGFGLLPEEIAEDLVGAGLASAMDAVLIAAL
jgi:hypothetical protein